jgi:WD40 repeat protein
MASPKVVVMELLLLTGTLAAGVGAFASPRPRTDRYGDPLPEGAIARIGTTRFRNSSNVDAICYSPDGKILAAIGNEGVRLWDAATGKALQSYDRFASPKDESFPRAGYDRGFFSPDGQRLWLQSSSAWQNSPGKEIYFWNLTPAPERKPRKAPFEGKDLYLLTPSPDGKFLAIGDKSSIRICKITTGEDCQRLKTSGYQACYSTDGKMLVASGGAALIFWNVPTGEQIRSIRAGDRRLRFGRFALAPDGKTVAVICRSRGTSIHLYDAATGNRRRELQLADSAARAMAISPDSKVLAVASQQSLRAWDVSSGQLLWEHRENKNQFFSVTFSPDSKTLAAGLGVEIHRYDAATGKQRPPLPDEARPPSVAPLGDGRNVATVDPGKRLRFWRLPNAEEIVPAPGWKPPAVPIVAAISADRRWMASQDHAVGEYRIWDIASGKEIHRFPFGKSSACSFTPDGKWLQIHDVVLNPSSHKIEHELRFWDLRSGKMVSELKGDRASMPVFSPDSRLYATQGATRGICCIGSVPDGSLVRTIAVGQGPWRFSFSADGRLLAGASLRDGRPRLWEVASGKEIATFSGFAGKGPDPTGFSAYEIAFSPNSREVVTGNYSGHLFCWDVEGRLVRQWKGDNLPVHYLHFTPDGEMLISGGTTTALLVWNIHEVLPSEKRRRTILTADNLNALWSDLKAEEATRAYRAVWKLTAAPDQAVPFLREQLRPARELDKTNAGKIVKLIRDLDNEAFSVREKASRELATFGKEAKPELRKALANDPSAESKSRIEELLRNLSESLPAPPPEQLRQLRALAVLEDAATPEAKKCLQTLAGGIAQARLTREAKAALERLTHKSSTAP